MGGTVYVTDFDVVGATPVADVLALLERHEAKIEEYALEGPGGANPNITVSFTTREKGLAFLSAWYEGDFDEDWLQAA